jgi:hypothetical protein
MSSRFLKVLTLLLLMGCGDSLPPKVEFSGTVSFRGQPLRGGAITFLSERGLQNSAIIDSNGHYHIKMFVGPSKIAVVNRMLRKDPGHPGPSLKRPGGNADTSSTIKGTYVPLPPKYQSWIHPALLAMCGKVWRPAISSWSSGVLSPWIGDANNSRCERRQLVAARVV